MPVVDAFGTDTRWRVSVGADQTSAAYWPATGRHRSGLFICGPSAGGHMAEPGMLRLDRPLLQAGLGVVHFNFLYREGGRRRPDPMPELRRCFAAVVESSLERIGQTGPVLLGGRSMGGRVASILVAEGYPCDGLLLLAYPLHPAGQPKRLRAAHLPLIGVPTLCFNGTRDRLCSRDLMEAAIAPLAGRWTMHWLEGADHSFDVLRSSGRTQADIETEIGDVAQGWLDSLEHRAG